MSAVLSIAGADAAERMRRFAFVVTIAAALYAGYLYVPDIHAGYATVAMNGHRGAYSSAYLAAAISILTSAFLGLIGFYLVRGALERDRTLDVQRNSLCLAGPAGNVRLRQIRKQPRHLVRDRRRFVSCCDVYARTAWGRPALRLRRLPASVRIHFGAGLGNGFGDRDRLRCDQTLTRRARRHSVRVRLVGMSQRSNDDDARRSTVSIRSTGHDGRYGQSANRCRCRVSRREAQERRDDRRRSVAEG